MSAKTNKELIKKFVTEVLNNRNTAFLEGRVAATYTNHSSSIPVRGPQGLKKAVEAQFKVFPDLHTTLEDIIAEGDKVVVRCTDHFTRQPDGVQVSISWIEIIRLEDGKLAEAWLETDTRLFSDLLLNEIHG